MLPVFRSLKTEHGVNMVKKLDPNKLTLGLKKELRKENTDSISENKINLAIEQIHTSGIVSKEKTEPTKRTTLDIPKSLHKQICQRALDKDLSLKDYFLDLVKAELKNG